MEDFTVLKESSPSCFVVMLRILQILHLLSGLCPTSLVLSVVVVDGWPSLIHWVGYRKKRFDLLHLVFTDNLLFTPAGSWS